jgi:hypothetical protein
MADRAIKRSEQSAAAQSLALPQRRHDLYGGLQRIEIITENHIHTRLIEMAGAN